MKLKYFIFFILSGLLCFSNIVYASQPEKANSYPTVRKYFGIISTKALLQEDKKRLNYFDLVIYKPAIHRVFDRPLGHHQIECSQDELVSEWKNHIEVLQNYFPNGLLTIGSNQESSELTGIQIKKIYEKDSILHVIFTFSSFERLPIRASLFQKEGVPALRTEISNVKINLNFI